MATTTEPPRWKLVIIRKGEREVRLVQDPNKGLEVVKRLDELGVKAHLICRRYPKFPPKGEPDDPEKLWCPYCRRWRYFSVPTRDCAARNLGVKCCQWCSISEEDFFIKKFNGTWSDGARKQRGRGKRRRRLRQRTG